jgi:hypothetical protein
LHWVELKRLRPATKEPYSLTANDGIFFGGDIPLGKYRVAEFGGRNPYTNQTFRFNLGELPQFEREIGRAGVYYLGSFKYKTNKPTVGRMSFELVPVKGPGERELLEKILPLAEHDYWKRLIRQRLGQLQR